MAKKTQVTWQQYIAAVISLIAILIFGGWYYCQQVYLKPQNVFWATIDKSLQTASVTESICQANEVQSFAQTTRLQFKGELASQTVVKINNSTPGATSTIETEIIGTPTTDYLRYNQLDSETTPAPENAVGVWAANQVSDTQRVDILSNDLLATPLIFGYLNHNQRGELIKLMKETQVFDIDFSAVDTTAQFEGKKAYSYDVSISLVGYITILQKYLQMINQNELAEQVGMSSADITIDATLIINPISRQIRQLTLSDYDTTVTFSNYDLSQMIQIPTDVQLKIDELQMLLLG